MTTVTRESVPRSRFRMADEALANEKGGALGQLRWGVPF